MKLLRKALAVTASLSLIFPLPVSATGPDTPEEWYADGQAAVQAAKNLKKQTGRAKNVILFVGDGMGVSTVTAARILEGQMRGQDGEENQLSFEKFPYLALSKTYSTNQQTSDSAPTMTAMVTGVKTGDGILSVNQYGVRGDYTTVAGNELVTILELAEQSGKSTGVVSTARITHATPGACYAHTVDRDWESDNNLSAAAKAAGFPDIARQLIEFPYGNGLEVALGGGRSKFLPNTANDPEDSGRKGERTDGRDLSSEWLSRYANSAYVWRKAEFDAINPATTDHLLGLFERSHMEYEYDRPTDTGGEPSLSEMTAKAIDILAKNKKGFFLHVEGGRIDHAHHAGNAYRALTDTIEFAKAVKVAMAKTDPKDTLIIVTADHSHVFTIAGYPKRGNPILGKVVLPGLTEPWLDMLGRPFTTVSYANGPGYTGASNAQPEGWKIYPHSPTTYSGITSGRPDLTSIDTTDPGYLQEATVPLSSETHAGEDVAIYATGPGAYLFHGVMEQSHIFHVMKEKLLP
jgi:alkaline phosphatase